MPLCRMFLLLTAVLIAPIAQAQTAQTADQATQPLTFPDGGFSNLFQ